MPNGRFAYAHLLNTHLTPLRRLFLDRSPPHFLSAAAPRRFEAGVCKQTSGGHLPSFRAAPRKPACASSRSCRHYYITMADQPVFGFAGLWDRSVAAEGTALESCTIITIPPNALMAEIHNAKQRMPAILQNTDIESWLTGSTDEARAALKPYPDDLMHAQKVSTRVNSPKNNHASLIEPAPLDPGQFVRE